MNRIRPTAGPIPTATIFGRIATFLGGIATFLGRIATLLGRIATLLGGIATVASSAGELPDPGAVYHAECASCHGERRYGGYAPPLIPSTLGRKSDEVLQRSIHEGLPNTQMPGFADKLDPGQIAALVAFVREPVAEIHWTLEDMRASRVEVEPAPPRIPPEISRPNLILVVERGTQSVAILDGDAMTELDRFHVGRIHGGIKFDAALNQALATTRDGTVVDYDLIRGGLRTKVKAGVNTRNIAVSTHGTYVAAANQLPQSLAVFDGRLEALRVFPLKGQPSAVYQLPGQARFVLTLRDAPLLYFLDYPDLELREQPLPQPFEDFVFVPGTTRLVASSRGGSQLLLYDYAQAEVLATLPTQGLPHLFSASFFEREGSLHAAFNHMGLPRLSVVEMDTFEVVREIPLLGPGFFTRTHEGTPYLWVDTNTEAIQLIEKASLEPLEATLVPAPGKKAMHVEFTAKGDKALVSVWDDDGAVVIYDSGDRRELGRLPYAMPVGKYNAANKTRALR